jgi:tetratricopeptide (TPR) repeat protein
VEAYGLLETDPSKVHGSDWREAIGEVAGRLEQCLPRQALEMYLRQSAAMAGRPPSQIVHRGSGWGALERLRRERCGESSFCSAGLLFDDESLGDDQAPWLTLLREGTLPEREPDLEPGAWIIQEEWRDLLQPSVLSGFGNHWLALLHLGVMHYGAGNMAAAEDAWRRSLQRCPSGWAYRNLAMLHKIEGRLGEALGLYRKAHHLLPKLKPLFMEFCDALLAARHGTEALALLDSAPQVIRGHSRMGVLKARAGLAIGLTHHCLPILHESFELVDIREGEMSLTDIWFAHSGFDVNGLARQNGDGDDRDPHHSIPAHLNFQVVRDPRSDFPTQQRVPQIGLHPHWSKTTTIPSRKVP